jgi:phosphatidylserine/phosphatidylglycerophosphate/cardiolipin synthase-like enzyme
MSEQLLKLSDTSLRDLAAALRSGRLGAPFSSIAVQRIVPSRLAQQIAGELQALADQGLVAPQIAVALDLLLADRSRRPLPEQVIDLVTSGPESSSAANRDTAVVVRELFAAAEQSVLVAGYAVYQGQQVFQALADRMRERPSLSVRLCLDVRRPDGDTSSSQDIVRRFADRFRRTEWPADRPLPEVYYFLASSAEKPEDRASLHAKCVVVDRRVVFVSSANFTEAAQRKNIEVGLLLRTPWLAERIAGHFESLVAERVLLPVL